MLNQRNAEDLAHKMWEKMLFDDTKEYDRFLDGFCDHAEHMASSTTQVTPKDVVRAMMKERRNDLDWTWIKMQGSVESQIPAVFFRIVREIMSYIPEKIVEEVAEDIIDDLDDRTLAEMVRHGVLDVSDHDVHADVT